MITAIERLKIRLAVSAGWSVLPGGENQRVSEVIRGFQATEADGVWHLYQGMRSISDPRERAIIFGHCLEEESHADAFVRAYRHYGGRVFSPTHFERKVLYAGDQPIWKTFAFVHVGEVDATQRFRLLEQALPSGALKECLGGVVSDEEGHIDLTYQMLKRLGASDGAIRAEVRWVRLRRLWERWLRVGKRVVDTLANVSLSIVYYVFGLLLYGAARRRLAAGFVAYDNNTMKKL
jgi:hypothetical protein